MKRQSPPWTENLEAYREFYNTHAQLFDTYEEYRGHYWRKPIRDYNEVPRYAAFLPWLKGHDILDVGCDGGALTEYLHRQGYHVIGLDIAEEYIARNRERMPEIEWVLAAFEETKYRKEFDALICAEVLEHVMSPGAFLQRALQCLRPGGVFTGTVPAAGGLHESGAWYDLDEHVYSFTPEEMHDLLGAYFGSIITQLVCGNQWVAFRAEKT